MPVLPTTNNLEISYWRVGNRYYLPDRRIESMYFDTVTQYIKSSTNIESPDVEVVEQTRDESDTAFILFRCTNNSELYICIIMKDQCIASTANRDILEKHFPQWLPKE